MISYDLDRDVALVGIWPSRPVTVAPVAPKASDIGRGDRVVSVGCSNGDDPTLLATRITQLDRYQGPANIEAQGPVEGRSGGGLFNAQGQLIGVCFAADHEGNEGLYARSNRSTRNSRNNGLSEIYERGAERAVAGDADRIVRGQEPLDAVHAAARDGIRADRELPGRATHGHAPSPLLERSVEQAAWEEIMARASTAEVICIIRPKNRADRARSSRWMMYHPNLSGHWQRGSELRNH